MLFSELQKVIAKGANVKEEAHDKREIIDSSSPTLGVDREYAKHVIGHLDQWSFVLRTDVHQRELNRDNLAVLIGLLQRVLRIHGLPIDKYEGIAALIERHNHGRSADERHSIGDQKNKRKRTPSGGSAGSATSTTMGGETSIEREKRRKSLTSQEGLTHPSDAKKRRFDLNEEAEQQSMNEPRRRDVSASHTMPQARQGGLSSAVKSRGPHQQPGMRGLSSSTSGIPRRSSNGNIDETKPSKTAEVFTRALSAFLCHWSDLSSSSHLAESAASLGLRHTYHLSIVMKKRVTALNEGRAALHL